MAMRLHFFIVEGISLKGQFIIFRVSFLIAGLVLLRNDASKRKARLKNV